MIQQLERAIAELNHQVRRHRDAIERAGGSSTADEAAIEQLMKNLAVSEKDLETAIRRRAHLASTRNK